MVVARRNLLSHHLLKFCSFFIAFILAIWPLPIAYNFFRPEIVALLTIYWVLHTPANTGQSYIWVVGLLLDMVEGGVWGAHALGLSLMYFVCYSSYRRIRTYPVWQQAFWVFVLIGAYQVIVSWVESFIGRDAQFQFLIMPAIISALLWPVLSVILFRLRYPSRGTRVPV